MGNTGFQATRPTPVQRDTDQAGRFDARDANCTAVTGAGQSILSHRGGASNTGRAGGQTLAGADFNIFIGARGGQQRFSSVATNAR